jgi:hypothetical protein
LNADDSDDDDIAIPSTDKNQHSPWGSEKRSEGRKSLVQGEVIDQDHEEQTISIIKELEEGKTMR